MVLTSPQPKTDIINFDLISRYTMLHVREIITGLNYDDLMASSRIPHLREALADQPMPSKRYPPWVYRNKSFSQFGLTMDYWVRRFLPEVLPECRVDFGPDPVATKLASMESPDGTIVEALIRYQDGTIPWIKVVYEGARLANFLMEAEPYTESDLGRYVPTLRNLAPDMALEWRKYGSAFGTHIQFNTEFNLVNVPNVANVPDSEGPGITAHPDIVTETAVLDIKTTTNFTKMMDESILQVLSYYAIMNQLHHPVRYVGFVLPIQRQIRLFDLEGWDWRPFLNALIERTRQLAAPVNIDTLLNLRDRIGRHIGTTLFLEDGRTKKITAPETLRQYLQDCGNVRPVQMFLRPNRNGHTGSITHAEIIEMRELIDGFGIPFFTHTPYLINLCSTVTRRDPNDPEWGRDVLRSDLTLTSEIGGRGVVVHTGTKTTIGLIISEVDALRNMEESVKSVLPNATEKCPLLLETPCGEGNEIVTTPESLADFYARFSEDERKRLKICVDSAHVWAAGYYPMDYIQRFTQRFGINSIALVHYNDSAVKFNSHVDRHAPIGRGYIPLQELIQVAEWACGRNIPLVIE
jgi:endonuclease IV